MSIRRLNSESFRPDQADPSLEDRISQHLRDEESVLVDVLDAVRRLHHSLQFMQVDEMRQALESESSALEAAREAQRSRYEFRREIGIAVGVAPEQLTLTLLAGKTSGWLREQIVQSRQRLSEMSEELRRLNHQNAAMLQQSLSLMRAVIGRLTRSAGFGEAYNAGGVRQESHVGSLLEWRG